MMVWFTPAMIVGRASGICTSVSFCQLDAPKLSAASSRSGRTWRIPRSVRRIIGGMA